MTLSVPAPASRRLSSVTALLLSLVCALLFLSGCKEDPAQPSGKGTIVGKVTDLYTSQPLRGAFVRTEPPTQSVNTDNDGNFRLNDVSIGEYEVRAEILGYNTRTVRVTLTSDITVTANFAMDSIALGGGGTYVPYNPVPTSGAQSQPKSTVLRWQCGDPTGAPISYDIYLGTTNPPATKVATGLSAPSYTPTNLQPSTTYYWRVLARSASGDRYGTIWSFSTSDTIITGGGTGTVLKFTGTGYAGNDTYINIPHSSDLTLSTGSYTIEAWIRPTALSGWTRVVSKANTNSNADYVFGTTGKRIELQTRNATVIMIGTTSLDTGLWYHIAAVFDASQNRVSLYINGVLDRSQTFANSTAITTGADLLIGARDGDGDPTAEGFHGFIHEVRIWNKARSQADILSTYLQRLTGSEAGLVGYWPLNEGSGTVGNDASGHGHHGVHRNNPLWIEMASPIQ